jgi:hypothetical protein
MRRVAAVVNARYDDCHLSRSVNATWIVSLQRKQDSSIAAPLLKRYCDYRGDPKEVLKGHVPSNGFIKSVS